jgi:disulfide bond formation protein DsbB
MFNATPLRWVAVVLPLAAVGAALVSQHVFDMQPCPWCVLQRLVFVALALAALPALLSRNRTVNQVGAGVTMLLAACGAAAALWQHFVAASTNSCKLSLADRIVSGLGLDSLWPQVFAAYATCADAAVSLWGLPYEAFSLALFVALGALPLYLLRRAA